MRRYLLRRATYTVIVLWAMITIMFFLFRFMPGDPTDLYLTQGMGADQRQHLLESWGLTKPLWVQYGLFLRNLITLDFGTSFFYDQPVMEILWPRMQNTLVLMIPAVSLGALMGSVLGVLYGWYRGTTFEEAGIVFSLGFMSVPIFWSGILIILVFSFELNWFPSSGMVSPATYADKQYELYLTKDFLEHAFLPFITAMIYYSGSPALIMRTSMLEVRNKQFMDTYTSWGLDRTAKMRHAAYNALPPVLTFMAVLVGYVFGGQVVLETVFAWPGVGRLLVDSVLKQDFPILQATFFIMGAIVVIMNFFVDIIHAYIDPRITYD